MRVEKYSQFVRISQQVFKHYFCVLDEEYICTVNLDAKVHFDNILDHLNTVYHLEIKFYMDSKYDVTDF